MHSDSSKIRKIYKAKTPHGDISEEERKSIHSQHSLVFLLLGMSLYPNTDTSLIAQKLFSCENFTNDINLAHNVSLTIISVLLFLFGSYHIYIFIGSIWASLLCHICHILTGFYGRTVHARNTFIAIFFFMGIFRSSLSFTCKFLLYHIILGPHIISKLFLFSAYLIFNNSRSAFSLCMGIFQAFLNNVTRAKTLNQLRLNLVIIHSLQAFITLVAAVWSTILFVNYKDKAHDKNDNFEMNKIIEKFQNFKYLKYYYPRFVLFHICSVKYLFHPGSIPFLLELPIPVKLRGSIVYTFGEFLGRNSSIFLDETVITKPGDSIDDSFFVIRDIPLFFLIFAIIALNVSILYSTFTAKIAISRSPSFVLTSLIISGFSYGYLISKATLGSKAILDHYSKKQSEIPRQSKVVSEVVNFTYYCSLFVPYTVSKLIQKRLRKSRVSRDYILTRNYGNLSFDDVSLLLTLLNK
ncbi:uncharacterized protein TA03170 [Theileria annulata]|uniref:Uncharacterized protein n=1 Tax=Theileria annulata TaxID=5874 RepID=Q4UCZ8_THEAN|nr:uncharacterized protein TA03170 [Theileria annulata]CAI75303.1 hypothetical protein TA03170 [Theileria annulata]|eukprot:XP_954779.1 hypothetical protein TA03170 [Theileria annulata]